MRRAGESRARADRRLTGILGLASALLFALGSGLWVFSQPALGASAGTVLAFYRSASSRIVIGACISLLAAAVFVLFAAGARGILREHEGEDLFATAAFGGAVLVVAAGLGAETINLAAAMGASGASLGPPSGRSLFEISYVLGYEGAGVGIAVVLLASVAIAARSRTLMPNWAAALCVVLALGLLTPAARFLLPAALLILLLVSARMLREPEPSRPTSSA